MRSGLNDTFIVLSDHEEPSLNFANMYFQQERHLKTLIRVQVGLVEIYQEGEKVSIPKNEGIRTFATHIVDLQNEVDRLKVENEQLQNTMKEVRRNKPKAWS